jgi:hypothetical protein
MKGFTRGRHQGRFDFMHARCVWQMHCFLGGGGGRGGGGGAGKLPNRGQRRPGQRHLMYRIRMCNRKAAKRVLALCNKGCAAQDNAQRTACMPYAPQAMNQGGAPQKGRSPCKILGLL